MSSKPKRTVTPKSYAKYKYIVGIDPGTNTGYAVWCRETQEFDCIETYNIVEAMGAVHGLYYECRVDSNERRPEDGWTDILLVVEDARTRGGTEAAKMGAGSIRRDCAIWQEFADHYDISILWRNTPRGKIRTTKLPAITFRNMTGWEGRTSNHARDAAMLVWKT